MNRFCGSFARNNHRLGFMLHLDFLGSLPADRQRQYAQDATNQRLLERIDQLELKLKQLEEEESGSASAAIPRTSTTS
jgi:hypothetical protein